METSGIYRKKVIDFLDRMPVGSVYIIDHICKAENKDMFIEIVKEYITSTRRAYSNGIEFTSDYSRIRKIDVSGLPKLYWTLAILIRIVTIAVPPYQTGEGFSLILTASPFFPLEKIPEKKCNSVSIRWNSNKHKGYKVTFLFFKEYKVTK